MIGTFEIKATLEEMDRRAQEICEDVDDPIARSNAVGQLLEELGVNEEELTKQAAEIAQAFSTVTHISPTLGACAVFNLAFTAGLIIGRGSQRTEE